MAIQNTFVNGNRYSWTSIEVVLGGRTYMGNPFKAISYNSKQEPGIVYGTSPRPIGRTRGQYLAAGSMEVYRSEWQDFVDFLMNGLSPSIGIHDLEFDITVSYAEPNSDVLTDVLVSCRMSNLNLDNSNGSDPSTVKCDLNMMELVLGQDATVGAIPAA